MTDTPRRLRILLVEDEKLNRDLVQAIVTRAADPTINNAELLEADTLAAARATLADEPVDIMLLDVQLPDGSGLTLAQELHDNPPANPPAVIALTAGILPDQQAAARTAGCRAILSKPHTAADLTSTLTAHLPASIDPASAAPAPYPP
jgi:two-component system KDP operon response regulator KdpE